ncbi:MAG: ribosomal L7Ae/L30e/S12e/Gadd45 family protein [Clostridiales bacterium]|nr:ribosomal L7Ae/L30e/S12e/Gadd45 family protein [Clostridiales bacterium]
MITDAEKKHIVVGYKQVLKAVKNNTCIKLFIAEDCSDGISSSLREASAGIETVIVPTMRELGAECGIDVPSSCAAVIGL